MATFTSFDGIPLYYDDQGDGHPVVLLHGFGADSNVNFVRSGILDALLDAGHRTLALDARGHGLSSKPTDPAAYANGAAGRDVVALLDHAELTRCTVVGYSMGAYTALRLAPDEPRIRALALLGIGDRSGRTVTAANIEAMFDELTAADPDELDLTSRRRLRSMAGMDRDLLVAMTSAGSRDGVGRIDDVDVPTLLVVGDDDEDAGDPVPLAARLHATLVRAPGDHYTVNSKPELHRALLEFLARWPARD